MNGHENTPSSVEYERDSCRPGAWSEGFPAASDQTPSVEGEAPLDEIVDSFIAQFRWAGRPVLFEMLFGNPGLASQFRDLVTPAVESDQPGAPSADCTQPCSSVPAASGSGRGDRSPDALGDFVITRWIGGGGMGVVYEAEHSSLKSRVALKVMHPRFRADAKYLRRFHAEARVAAALHHTNIVSVFDYGEQDGVCYYAMQYIEGQPLDRVLAEIRWMRDGSVMPNAPGSAMVPSTSVGSAVVGATVCDAEPDTAVSEPSAPSSSLNSLRELRYFQEVARIGAQVAEALEYAHRRGVLHRDIKPSNLLLDALGSVWVTDFGLAKHEEWSDLSASRDLVGTLRYMAPERLRGVSDRRGDIYALGATLYEMLVLRPAFAEPDQFRLVDRIKNDVPVSPRQIDRDIPRDLETIVMKALAKDAADRFKTAGDLADELQRFVGGPRSARVRFRSSSGLFAGANAIPG